MKKTLLTLAALTSLTLRAVAVNTDVSLDESGTLIGPTAAQLRAAVGLATTDNVTFGNITMNAASASSLILRGATSGSLTLVAPATGTASGIPALIDGNVSFGSVTTPSVIADNLIGSGTDITNLDMDNAAGGTLAVARGGTGLTALGTGVATWLGTPSSANLASAVTGETGSGALVFGTSPTLVTPALGAATATSINGNVFTAGSSTYTGTAGQTYIFPSTTATIARIDAAQSFSGNQTFAQITITGNRGVWYSSTFSQPSNGLFSWSDSATNCFTTQDTSIWRSAAGEVSIGVGAASGSGGNLKANSISASGILTTTPNAQTATTAAVSVTTTTTKLTTTAGSQAITLANGADGQIKRIVHVVDGGSAILTPATKTGYTSVTLDDAGDSIELQYFTTVGWCIISSYGVTVTP